MNESIRNDFPALTQKFNDKPLVYLDSAASALKPQSVVDRLAKFYAFEASNVHRGIHTLSAQATDEYELGRKKVQKFLRAKEDREIVFTKGTTESVNLVAQTWGKKFLKPGDEILLSEMEHHSNLVPWHLLVEEKEITIRYIPVTESGELDLTEMDRLLTEKTKLVAVSHCSNTLGTINPVKKIAKKAHEVGALVLVDGAQSVTGMPIDVQDIDCDFFVFSGHKLFGPYGIGCLYGKAEILEQMPPYQGGGSMIEEVSLEGSTYNNVPFRFEAGTPHISGVIGLGAAIDYVSSIGMEKVFEHKVKLQKQVHNQLVEIPGLRILGASDSKLPIFSFVIDGIHANDIGEILNQEAIAVRTGHHCTQPLMKKMNVTATVRASFSIYNNTSDLERLCSGLIKSKEFLG